MLTVMFAPLARVHLARFSGPVSWAEFEALDLAVIAFAARNGAFDAILDFSAAGGFAVPETRIMTRGRAPQLIPGRRRLIVVRTFEQEALARLFIAEQTQLGATPPEIVRSIEEAFSRLGVSEDEFEALSLTR